MYPLHINVAVCMHVQVYMQGLAPYTCCWLEPMMTSVNNLFPVGMF